MTSKKAGPGKRAARGRSPTAGFFASTGVRDAHIHGDFIVLYRLASCPEEIVFERLGTHSQLFG